MRLHALVVLAVLQMYDTPSKALPINSMTYRNSIIMTDMTAYSSF